MNSFLDVSEAKYRAVIDYCEGGIDYDELYQNGKKNKKITPSYTDWNFNSFERALHPKYAAPSVNMIKIYDTIDPDPWYPLISQGELVALEVNMHIHTVPDFDELDTTTNRQFNIPETTVVIDWWLDNSGKDAPPSITKLYTMANGVLGMPKYENENWLYRRFSSKAYHLGAIHATKWDGGLDSVPGYQLIPTSIPPPTTGSMVMPTAYMAFSGRTSTYDKYHFNFSNCPQFMKADVLANDKYESKCNNLFFTVRCSTKNNGPSLEHYELDMSVRLYWRKWSSGIA